MSNLVSQPVWLLIIIGVILMVVWSYYLQFSWSRSYVSEAEMKPLSLIRRVIVFTLLGVFSIYPEIFNLGKPKVWTSVILFILLVALEWVVSRSK